MFHFDSSVFLKNGTYFDGFYQTEKYFKEIRGELLKELTINKPLSNYSQNILGKIKEVSAVSIHVRRADYITGSTFARRPHYPRYMLYGLLQDCNRLHN